MDHINTGIAYGWTVCVANQFFYTKIYHSGVQRCYVLGRHDHLDFMYTRSRKFPFKSKFNAFMDNYTHRLVFAV